MTDNEYQKHASDICQSLLSRTNTSIECIEIALIVLRSVIKSCPDQHTRIGLIKTCVRQLEIDSTVDAIVPPSRIL